MYNLPKWLAEPGSYWLNRWLARKSDPVSVRRRYAAMDATLAALESVPDSDWDKGAAFYGHGFHSVRDLFARRRSTWPSMRRDGIPEQSQRPKPRSRP
ncbi:MAG: hypothetical protein HZY76_00535 [Anaerolineae bacterium]|nr:MAG: hypothetical protein HZY76_00535 [Anaerolineae bacterium]